MDDRLRILLAIHHELDSDTGAPGTTMALRDCYRALGHEVKVLSFDDMPVRRPFLAAQLAFPSFVAKRLAQERRRGLDVVDASAGDAWVWATLTRAENRPVLVTRSHGLEHLRHERTVEHARNEGEQVRWRYWVYRGGWRLKEVQKAIEGSDLTFVLNEDERQYVVNKMGIPEERVRLTANGLRDELLEVARKANAGEGPRSDIAYIGNYRPMKGTKYGAAALTAQMRAHPDLRASYIGTGVPREQVLADFPAELHERIATIDHYNRPDLPSILEGHGILLFPSLTEGFSVALIEAMACGLVPVAAENQGARQAVQSGQNGLLVPLADAGALETELGRLLDDAPLRERLQAGARETGLNHSWSRIAAQRVEDYRTAIARRQGAAQ